MKLTPEVRSKSNDSTLETGLTHSGFWFSGQVINPRKVSTPQYRGGGGQVTVVADKDAGEIKQVRTIMIQITDTS